MPRRRLRSQRPHGQLGEYGRSERRRCQSINVIDEAKTPEAPSGPKRTLYIAVAFLAGIFIAVAYVVLADMLNTRIRGAEEAEELLGIPVVGRIPAMKGGK